MSMKRPWMAALLIVACCYGSLALAELTPVDPKTRQDIVFQILGQIANRVTGWEAQVTSAASYLFWTLSTISLSWTMGMMILKRADLGEFFAEFIRFIFFFGLFYGLLRQGPTVARLILESMLQLGQETAGSTIKYQTFMDIGMELMSRADQFQQTGASKEDGFLVVGLCGAILLMLTTMVINLFLVFVAGWFLMYAGIFFLGFGGSRWTSDIAIGYYKAVIAVGIQMFVMALIMGIATDVLGDFFDKFSFELRFYELMTFLVATFAFMTIFNRIPPLLSGLISGASIGLSQGELGGALRGANGADPFGAGRTALGTAASGAQKLFAAMAKGLPDGRIQSTDSLMSLPDSRNQPPSAPSGLGSGSSSTVGLASASGAPSSRGLAAGMLGAGEEGQQSQRTQENGEDKPLGRNGSMLGDASNPNNAMMASIAAEERNTGNASVPDQSTPVAARPINGLGAGSTAGATPAQVLAQNAPPSTVTPVSATSRNAEGATIEATRENESRPAEFRVARLEGVTSNAQEPVTSQSLQG